MSDAEVIKRFKEIVARQQGNDRIGWVVRAWRRKLDVLSVYIGENGEIILDVE